ncbi:DUF4440 domain-containing protein, partial [candidate division KSB1 bacterium]
ISDVTVSRGWEKVFNRYKERYDSREKMGRLTFRDVEVAVTGPESGFIMGTWALSRKNDDPGGKFTIIFKKFSEGWKIIHDHTSSENE